MHALLLTHRAFPKKEFEAAEEVVKRKGIQDRYDARFQDAADNFCYTIELYGADRWSTLVSIKRAFESWITQLVTRV